MNPLPVSLARRGAWLVRSAGVALLLTLAPGCLHEAPSSLVGMSRPRADQPEDNQLQRKRDGEAGLPADIVQRSAVTVTGIRADGERLDLDQVLDELSHHDAICLGMNLNAPEHHWVGLRLARGLLEYARVSGHELTFALPMVDRQWQSVVERFVAFKLSEEGFRDLVEWNRRAAPDFALYRPYFDFARARHLTIAAVGLDHVLLAKVNKSGLDSLPEEVLGHLPELDLDDVDDRAAFEAASTATPKGEPRFQYEAHVVTDEVIAETAVQALKERAPARHLMVSAPVASCKRQGIPQRIRRRSRVSVASVVLVSPADLKRTPAHTDVDYLLELKPRR